MTQWYIVSCDLLFLDFNVEFAKAARLFLSIIIGLGTWRFPNLVKIVCSTISNYKLVNIPPVLAAKENSGRSNLHWHVLLYWFFNLVFLVVIISQVKISCNRAFRFCWNKTRFICVYVQAHVSIIVLFVLWMGM